MKIAYLHPHFAAAGGAGRFVLQTAAGLAQRGNAVHIVTIATSPRTADAAAAGVCFHEIGGPLSSKLGFWLNFRGGCRRVLRVLDKIAPDILFPQVFPANWWGFYAKKRRPLLPCVAFCHEPSAFVHSRDWLNALPPGVMRFLAKSANPILRPIDVALGRRADYVLTNSRYTTAYAQRVYGYAADRITNLDLGVDHARFVPAPAAGRPARVVTIAKLTRFKNIDVIIRAIARLVANGLSDIELHIIGEGDARPGLESLAKSLEIADRVVFRGAVSDEEVVAALRQSRAFVLASVDEPFGLVAVEAMACGTPAVVVGRGGPAESVLDNESGFHVPPHDYEALAARLTVLLRDDGELARLSHGAVRRAAQYDWERTTDALASAFARISSKPGAPPAAEHR